MTVPKKSWAGFGFAVIFIAAFSLVPHSAHAFKILSALTDACHEKITLGALGHERGGFLGDGLPSTTAMLARMAAKAEITGIPTDEASYGLRRENARRYGLGNLSLSEQYVISSFLAGVRAPDTGGYSIVDFSRIRGSHIRDDEQSAHFLRRKLDDGPQGDQAVILETTNRLTDLANHALSQWSSAGGQTITARWTFAFYGERDVRVFAPAYYLGLIAHAIQDSYAHALRDDADMRIIAVANYLDVVMDGYSSGRDGPGHSERLDQCNEHDAFDLPRIDAARRDSARVFAALDTQFAVDGLDTSAFTATLQTIFDYKSGCTQENSYCGGLWFKKSIEEISEPHEIGCGLVKSQTHDDHHQSQQIIMLLGLFAPILIALFLRNRARS